MKRYKDKVMVPLTPEVKQWLVEQGEKCERPVSYIVRQAIDAYIKKEKRHEQRI